ncbi:MAG: twin-arginine translocation signal domain-containing protein [Actinobacteria bacterium]|nr:twin-arginine translocation signal domain-containing protein [Actinomycetota bacterium]
MDRRDFLRTTGVAGAALTTGFGRSLLSPRLGGVTPAEQTGAMPTIWKPTALGPAMSHTTIPSDPNTLRGHTTLMFVRDKLGNAAIDNWYLWQWTHDTSRTYLYSAPKATGPFTARGFGNAPTPYPANYLVNHFSSGDIVWEPERRVFISSPHGVRLPPVPGNAEVSQDSFLTSSPDGLNWSWLDGDSRPRLICGPPKSVDSVHTGYGRLLRDLDGHIATQASQYWWIYRAQRNDGGNPIHAIHPFVDAVGTTYTPMLASTDDLTQTFDRKRQAYPGVTLNTGLISFGSFVRTNKQQHVFMVQALPDPPIAPAKTLHYVSKGNSMNFGLPQPVVQIVNAKGAIIEENNIARDPETGKIYNCHVQGSLDANANALIETWIYEGA